MFYYSISIGRCVDFNNIYVGKYDICLLMHDEEDGVSGGKIEPI